MILAAAEGQGIPSMTEDGIEKVLAGITSLTELRRVVDLSAVRNEKSATSTPTENTPEAEVDITEHTV